MRRGSGMRRAARVPAPFVFAAGLGPWAVSAPARVPGPSNAAPHMQPAQPPSPAGTSAADALERVTKYFTKGLKSRYMERDCEPTSYPEWEGFPVIKCRYDVKDRDGTGKSATVVMLKGGRKLAWLEVSRRLYQAA